MKSKSSILSRYNYSKIITKGRINLNSSSILSMAKYNPNTECKKSIFKSFFAWLKIRK